MKKDKVYLPIIGVLSVAVPIVVAILLFIPEPFRFGTYDFTFLSHLNAFLNSMTALCLLAGFIIIKTKRNERLHKTFMYSAFVLSSLFLISYVIYHSQVEHTVFGGKGLIKSIYLCILISHIVLSTAVIPLVLTSIYFAVTKRIDRHKKIVAFTFPIWFYVAVTGVIVYLMIRPYYPV